MEDSYSSMEKAVQIHLLKIKEHIFNIYSYSKGKTTLAKKNCGINPINRKNRTRISEHCFSCNAL